MAQTDELHLPLVPREGLSLAALRSFAEEHVGEEYVVQTDAQAGTWAKLPFAQLTTAQVCAAVVKPATAPGARARGGGKARLRAACAYSATLRGAADARGAPCVAPATRFVSHAWTYRFVDLMAALEANAREDDSEHYWIDIFVCNQHTADSMPSRWWFDAFAAAVADIGHTVLVLQPWQAPRPLKRSWCLWEINSTIARGGELDIALAPEERAAFHRILLTQFERIKDSLSQIDTEKAEAFVESDATTIADAVRASAGGFQAVNARILEGLRAWLAQQAQHLWESRRSALGAAHADTCTAAVKLAGLLRDQGRLEEAESRCREALAGREAAPELGPEHLATLECANALANVLRDRGLVASAVPLYRRVLDGRRRALAAAAADADAATLRISVLDAVNNLGTALHDTRALDEAAPLYAEALEGKTALLGPAHPRTLGAAHNMGLLRSSQGRLAEAEALLRGAFDERSRVLGRAHPDTLDSAVTLATVLAQRGEAAEAERLHAATLRLRQQQLGAAHPATVVSALACARLAQRADVAEALLREAYGALRPALPAGHASALSVAAALLDRLLAQRRDDDGDGDDGGSAEVEELCRFVLEGRRAAHGAAHPATLAAVDNLARVLSARAPAAAAALYREALQACAAAGADAAEQPAALDCAFNLAVLMHKAAEQQPAPASTDDHKRKADALHEAEPLYRRVLRAQTAALGSEAADTLTTTAYLEQLLEDRESAARAELADLRQERGADDVVTLSAAAALVRVLLDRRCLSDAEALGRDTLDRARRALGETHPVTLSCTTRLGWVLDDLGQCAEAEALLRAALAAQCSIHGPAHPDTLDATNELAWHLHGRQGRTDEAVTLARAAARGFDAALGAADSETLNAMDTLAAALAADGRADEAAAVKLDIAARSRTQQRAATQ